MQHSGGARRAGKGGERAKKESREGRREYTEGERGRRESRRGRRAGGGGGTFEQHGTHVFARTAKGGENLDKVGDTQAHGDADALEHLCKALDRLPDIRSLRLEWSCPAPALVEGEEERRRWGGRAGRREGEDT